MLEICLPFSIKTCVAWNSNTIIKLTSWGIRACIISEQSSWGHCTQGRIFSRSSLGRPRHLNFSARGVGVLCSLPRKFLYFSSQNCMFQWLSEVQTMIFHRIRRLQKETKSVVINDEYDYLKQAANLFFCNLSNQSVTVIPGSRFVLRAHRCSEMAFCRSHASSPSFRFTMFLAPERRDRQFSVTRTLSTR
jgi:hypothetical protein